jgi:hypothetical protein
MIIYEPHVAEAYEFVNCHDDDDYEVFNQLDGSPRADQWKPVEVIWVREDDGRKYKPSDFPFLGLCVFVMRRRALEALRDILDAHGEILSLATDDGVELFAFNARMVDALDEARSTLERFPDSNRIMWIKKVAFIESAIRGLDMFRLPDRGSVTYVSQRFVDRVNAAGLVGLEFDKVWSSQ